MHLNENIMCRSRFDIFMSSGPQSNADKRAIKGQSNIKNPNNSTKACYGNTAHIYVFQ